MHTLGIPSAVTAARGVAAGSRCRFLLAAAILLALTPVGVSAVEFPLRVSPDRTHLVDSRGVPFLIVGDTAWSLIAQLDRRNVVRYLEDRRRRGFNSLIVNLIEAKFASRAPGTLSGIAPFEPPGDFSHPNPAYFEWAHECLAAARDRGFAVFLCPAYLGWRGGDEGFFRDIARRDAESLEAYGRFVAERFKDLPNIVWMVGGDYSMPENQRWTVNLLAKGIRARDAVRLLTGHAGQKSPRQAFGDPDWLQVDNTYSYDPALWRQLLADSSRLPRMPVFLSETVYEGEHKATPGQIRRQAWWAMLSGHCGQFFGNNPIWHFDGPGLFPVADTWKQALDGAGSRDIARLGGFFRKLSWFRLAPDTEGRLLRDPGEGTARIAAAISADSRVAVVYVPSTGRDPRDVVVADDVLRSLFPRLRATWWNPTDGGSHPASGPPFRTPGDNGTGDNDWVLQLQRR